MHQEKPVTKGEMIDAIAALHVIKDAPIRNKGDFSGGDRETLKQSSAKTRSQLEQKSSGAS